MSVVIGICGTNFCSLIADGRLVIGDYPNIQIVSEKVMKVYKINDQVLIGGAGWFLGNEEITTPLDIYPDKGNITLVAAVDSVVKYIEKRKHIITANRNYLVGGKDEAGRFAICDIQYDAVLHKTSVNQRIPQAPQHNFAVVCCFPPKINERYAEFFKKVSDCVTTSRDYREMVNKVVRVINEIAQVDDSVNSNVLAVNVF